MEWDNVFNTLVSAHVAIETAGSTPVGGTATQTAEQMVVPVDQNANAPTGDLSIGGSSIPKQYLLFGGVGALLLVGFLALKKG